uniref:Ribosomal protein L34Ae n=1 Tax=Kalanchoe fedtschenkoi TaxID=63787 RepID=A0A7N0RER9_KALFE
MGVSNWFVWGLGMDMAKMGLVTRFLYRNTSKLAGDVAGSVSGHLVPLLGVPRLDDDKLSCSAATQQLEFDSVYSVTSAESEGAEFFSDGCSEEDASPESPPKLVFKFQSYEDFCRSKTERSPADDEAPARRSFCEFLEESVAEPMCRSRALESGEALRDGFLWENDFVHPSCQDERRQIDRLERELSGEDELQKKAMAEDCESKSESAAETELDSVEVKAEAWSESESSESMVSDDGSVGTSRVEASISDGFLSDRDFVAASPEHCVDTDSTSGPGPEDVEYEDVEVNAIKDAESLMKSLSENRSLEEEDAPGSHFLTEDDFDCADEKMNDDWGDEDEDDEELETQWEHQDILEQLSIEIKNVRATGLPTIDEHTEISKFSENLKPWRIDEKFPAGDTFTLVHKFYRSYWEKMRKLDILSFQKMYAIGLLQSKDPLKSVASEKPVTPSFAVFNSLCFSKNRKIQAEPMMKFIRELRDDLELVYVAQMCLSWDILHWQYEKALEIWEADPHGLRRFNLACGEFQQFQILLQRFIEDERYQGPRVQTYVDFRRSLHNLPLQVPVIREDKKEKRKVSPLRDELMSSDVLVEAMEESIRTFWQFVRADKPEPAMRKSTQCQLQDPADSELLSELTRALQKKEKKLRDAIRTGSCIFKKFKPHRREDDHADQVLCFFSQVDLKLVARVLRMTRLTTDQLRWCGLKLSSMSFVNGRIHVEPSFSLFPC